jgi:tRNA (guanine37-N1)-methyltransferase
MTDPSPEVPPSTDEPTQARPALRVKVLTLFPDFFRSPLETSILGRAVEDGSLVVEPINIRDHADGKHRVTDDTPYGGGAGMVMKPDPIVRALEAAEAASLAQGAGRPWRIALTPAGQPFRQADARRLAALPSISLLCGRYEGIDERAMDEIDEQLSLGDFVLTGGEVAALAIIDAVARLLPGVLGNQESPEDESFGQGVLEYPQYTRPAVFRGRPVPDILRSGDHGRIARWRRQQALLRTRARRPDLFAALELSRDDLRLLAEAHKAEPPQGSPEEAS